MGLVRLGSKDFEGFGCMDSVEVAYKGFAGFGGKGLPGSGLEQGLMSEADCMDLAVGNKGFDSVAVDMAFDLVADCMVSLVAVSEESLDNCLEESGNCS